MAKRRLSRWIAPIALVVALGAILAVVNNSDVGGKTDSTTESSSTVTGASKSTKKSAKKTKTTYTVHTGDTLSAIAEKTGVPLEEIERLNPGLDAQSLHAGQKIKLVKS